MAAASSAKFPDSPDCVPLSVPISGDMGSCEVLGDELDSLLDACVPTVEQHNLVRELLCMQQNRGDWLGKAK